MNGYERAGRSRALGQVKDRDDQVVGIDQPGAPRSQRGGLRHAQAGGRGIQVPAGRGATPIEPLARRLSPALIQA